MKFLDGFDKDTWYQMVPAQGGTVVNSFPWRFMTVVTENNPCKLTVDDQSLVQLSAIGPPPTEINNDTVIPANRRTNFLISARTENAGFTSVSLMDVGNPKVPISIATLNVSVKKEVQASYAILLLSDTAGHITMRTPSAAVRLMQLVQATFMAQANVNLTQVGAPTPLVVPGDLGNPLNVDNVAGVLTPILKATPATFVGGGINRIYCCWDVADDTDGRAPIGDTRDKNCFVEDGTNEFTFAHEFGHALTLKSHNKAATPGRPLLMDESLGRGTFKLQQFEIDLLNPSGKFGT